MVDGVDKSALVGPGRRPNRTSEIRPSTVKLPERAPPDVQTIFEFFIQRFPRVARETWEERFAAGKVWAIGESIDSFTPYRPLLEVHYRREVEQEPPVREDYRVVWSDSHLMVVDKPPNLPVTPGGHWVRNCLLHLLFEATGNDQIVPVHRLDRLTSGVMIFSVDSTTRSHFADLFRPPSMVEKTYTAVCELQGDPPSRRFTLAHNLVRSPEEYWRQVVRPELPANSRAEVVVIAVEDDLALVQVQPATGRRHQLRVQLAHEGLPILGDPLYGAVRSYDPYDVSQRLWLDARRLSVDAFPGSTEAEMLTGEWTSLRSPLAFFKRAQLWRESVRSGGKA